MKEMMKPDDFQTLMVERLRADVGKLIPDEKLAELVEQGIQKMFFTREVKSDHYNRQTEYPSWFEKEIEKLLRERVTTFYVEWFKANDKRITDALESTIQGQLPRIMATVMMGFLQNSISATSYGLSEAVMNDLRSRGVGV